ncbi:sulfotransferase [Haloechinothrix salitolerans]|uniref:Sulfotransferase family protein n=1 Tax=Haloechinothrix salitolerans TaxID=926830 RepID=A0ABW2BUR9_9PSEU
MRDSVGTVADLHDSATKVTGLDDFGDDVYLEGLEVLLDSYEREAELTPLGNSIMRASLRGALVARLLAEAAWRQYPDHADIPIERPIFVTGLSRTGTTALHRLLTADPAHQGLELWLTDVPQPRPPRETWVDDPIYQQIKAGYDKHHAENPDFMGLHYTSADSVEECWRLLRQSMKSVSEECLAYVPSYSRWLSEQDWTDAYARHRRLLQLIGRNEPGKRWVLKNPSHLFALDELLAVYPDALIVQTHRPPSTTLASTCSLSLAATDGWSAAFTPEVIGRTQLDLWARGLATFAEARTRHDPARFCDVDYDDFVADPVGTAEGIYRHFGLPLSDAARAEMRRVDAESRTGPRKPSHQYALSDFGLTAAQVEERFADYVGAASR